VLFRQSNGDGIDSRLLAALEKKTGCKFELMVMPRKRIWLELERGTLDIATGGIPTAERRAYSYALPYFRARNLALIRKEVSLQAKTPEALEASPLKVGIVRGFRHEPFYDAMADRLTKQSGRVTEAVDVRDNLRMLERGVVDVVFSQPVVFNEYLNADALRAIVIKDWAPQDQYSIGALMLQRKSFTPAQAQAWDELVVRMLNDGSMLQINRRFLSAAEAKGGVYTGPRMLD
jgi:polar amino acid transport system substrate-binding protein